MSMRDGKPFLLAALLLPCTLALAQTPPAAGARVRRRLRPRRSRRRPDAARRTEKTGQSAEAARRVARFARQARLPALLPSPATASTATAAANSRRADPHPRTHARDLQVPVDAERHPAGGTTT